MCPIVWSKSDQRRLRKTLHKRTNRQTNRQTDTTKIMVTWPWTINSFIAKELYYIFSDESNTLDCCCTSASQWLMRDQSVCQSSMFFGLESIKFACHVAGTRRRRCIPKAKGALFMAALWNRAGHYIFVMWFLLLSSFFLSFFLFSSPILSGRR